MEKVLSSLQWQVCLVYIDDIIVFSKDLASHIQNWMKFSHACKMLV